MKSKRIHPVLSLVVGIVFASSAGAARVKKKWSLPAPKIPRGWIQVKTAAYDMFLPRDFRLIGERADDPKRPWIGRWRFATPGGRQKLHIRVEPLGKATLAAVLETSVAKMRKRASEVKKLGGAEPLDEKGRPFIIGSYQATLNAKNHRTKKIEARPHLVIRMVQQYPEVKLQAIVTYLFTASRFEEGRRFVAEHTALLNVYDTKRQLDAVRRLGARYPRAATSVKPHPLAKLFEKKVRYQRTATSAKPR